MYMKVQRSVFCSMVLIFEFLLILMGCGGGGCPTVSRTGSSSSSGTGGTRTSSNVCGTSNGNGSGSGINGQCTGKLSPTEVLYSFDIPTDTTSTVANILPFAIGSNGALTLMCGNASANIGQLALIGNKFLYAFDSTSATIAGFSIAHGNSGALTAIPGSPFTISDTFSGSTNFPRIEADPLGRFVFITNFAAGQIDVFQVDQTTGALTVAPSSPFNTSSLQVAPFMLALDATGTFLYVSDTGNNGIPGFTVDGTTGALTLINGSPFPGSSASDLVPNPAGPQLYVQIGNSINVYSIDATSGALTPPSVQAQFFTASNLVIAKIGRAHV